MTDTTLTSQPLAPAAIDPGTTLGPVALTVSDLGGSRDFYETAIGLRADERDDGTIGLAVPGGPTLVTLRGDASARALDRRAPGLFHLAILLPSRLDLAHALARLAQARYPIDGASDHLVSEALYLSDPDGHGIEIYRDRPRDQWRYENGAVQMATLALDMQAVADELRAAPAFQAQVPAATTIGHVHLQVSDIPRAEDFYHGVLGFDVVVRTYPGALFVSAGGDHHHLGLNVWNSRGSARAQPGAIGLRSFTVALPDRDALARVLERVAAAGLVTEAGTGGATIVRDPFGTAVALTVAAG
jgi:catechol 2,3-dioxygenase